MALIKGFLISATPATPATPKNRLMRNKKRTLYLIFLFYIRHMFFGLKKCSGVAPKKVSPPSDRLEFLQNHRCCAILSQDVQALCLCSVDFFALS